MEENNWTFSLTEQPFEYFTFEYFKGVSGNDSYE